MNSGTELHITTTVEGGMMGRGGQTGGQGGKPTPAMLVYDRPEKQ